MTNEKKVKIILQTKINTQGIEDIFELTVFGTVNQKGNTIYIRYVEQIPDGEVKSTVKYNGNNVLIIRNGALKMRQQFQKGTETSCFLQNAIGTIHLSAKTYSIHYYRDELTNIETLYFSYDLSVQFEYIGLYELTFTLIPV